MANSATSQAPGAGATRLAVIVALGGCGVLGAGACKDPPPSATLPEAGAAASAAPSSSAPPSREPIDDDRDQVRPVYPIDGKPPLPAAERYCNAVKETPKRRREECCPPIGAIVMTGECIRTLSSALRSGAVKLDEADLDGCVAAVTKETAGCDWVTSGGMPTPHACLGIIKGTLKEDAVCRSNLECEEGLRCRALGATRPGKCAPPLARGMCNIATDSLASFTGQEDVERHHPECSGACLRRQCFEAAAGAACTGTFQCGPKAYCVGGKCVEGPPPAIGQPCTDACGPGARCSKGKCVAPKAAGDSCEDDAECRGKCARGDGGKLGQCGADCPSFVVPPKRR